MMIQSLTCSGFSQWGRSSFLDINISKTKEMIIGFSRNPAAAVPQLMNNQGVEVVKQYKYLGTIIDDKLSFELQVDAACKKV